MAEPPAENGASPCHRWWQAGRSLEFGGGTANGEERHRNAVFIATWEPGPRPALGFWHHVRPTRYRFDLCGPARSRPGYSMDDDAGTGVFCRTQIAGFQAPTSREELNAFRALFGAVCTWIARYEQCVAEHIGIDYRAATIDQWKGDTIAAGDVDAAWLRLGQDADRSLVDELLLSRPIRDPTSLDQLSRVKGVASAHGTPVAHDR
jgi:hypothetical protein